MKKQIKILMLAVMLIVAYMLPVNAADATVTLNASKTELYPGDTFTVTMNVACEEGINGLSTVVSYDEAKLTLQKSEIIDTTKWFNLGENLSFDIVHYASGIEKSANILKLTFKVKDTAPEKTTAKIKASNIKVDSDASKNSIKEIGTKEVEVSILERLYVNISEYEQEQQSGNKYIKGIAPRTLFENLLERIQTNGTVKIFKNNIEINDNESSILYGDVNCDGEVDELDSIYLTRHIESWEGYSLTEQGKKNADLNKDGKINKTDVDILQEYLVGNYTSLPQFNIATGMEIRISLNSEMLSYKTVVKGDTDGDGDATFNDILQINKHRLNKASLQNEYLKAADLTADGIVDFMDILQINKYRLGKIDSL